MKTETKKSLITIFSLAIMSGVIMIGSSLVYAVQIPTEDPQTATGVAPTFSGLIINGIIKNTIVKRSNNAQTLPVLVNDDFWIYGDMLINAAPTDGTGSGSGTGNLSVAAGLTVTALSTFFGDIDLQGFLSNRGAANGGNVIIDDNVVVGSDQTNPKWLDIKGPILNSSTVGQIDDPGRSVTINDNLTVKGDGTALEISSFEDDVVVGKGVVIGTGLRVGAIPGAGGFVQPGLAVLGNTYVGYDPNTNQTATSNLDVWGDIVRSQSNGGTNWPVTINDKLDVKGDVKNSSVTPGRRFTDPATPNPITILDDLVIIGEGGVPVTSSGNLDVRGAVSNNTPPPAADPTGDVPLFVNDNLDVGTASRNKKVQIYGSQGTTGDVLLGGNIGSSYVNQPLNVNYGLVVNGNGGLTLNGTGSLIVGISGQYSTATIYGDTFLNGNLNLTNANGVFNVANGPMIFINRSSNPSVMGGDFRFLNNATFNGNLNVAGTITGGGLGTILRTVSFHFVNASNSLNVNNLTIAAMTASCPTGKQLLSCNLYLPNTREAFIGDSYTQTTTSCTGNARFYPGLATAAGEPNASASGIRLEILCIGP